MFAVFGSRVMSRAYFKKSALVFSSVCGCKSSISVPVATMSGHFFFRVSCLFLSSDWDLICCFTSFSLCWILCWMFSRDLRAAVDLPLILFSPVCFNTVHTVAVSTGNSHRILQWIQTDRTAELCSVQLSSLLRHFSSQ